MQLRVNFTRYLMVNQGVLYLVATPIGNLSDFSIRAREVMEGVDLILAEDTRHSGLLLARYKITTKMASFHEHSSDEKISWVITLLKEGKNLALVSDGGTPNIADPGGKLVEAVMKEGLKVSPIPGPSPLTALISVAPFSCTPFIFMGFFPKKKGRQTMIKTIESSKYPIFFFESPHRIKKTLQLLSSNMEGYQILIGRELTKKFEEVRFFDLKNQQELDTIREQGEFVFSLVKKK